MEQNGLKKDSKQKIPNINIKGIFSENTASQDQKLPPKDSQKNKRDFSEKVGEVKGTRVNTSQSQSFKISQQEMKSINYLKGKLTSLQRAKKSMNQTQNSSHLEEATPEFSFADES